MALAVRHTVVAGRLHAVGCAGLPALTTIRIVPAGCICSTHVAGHGVEQLNTRLALNQDMRCCSRSSRVHLHSMQLVTARTSHRCHNLACPQKFWRFVCAICAIKHTHIQPAPTDETAASPSSVWLLDVAASHTCTVVSRPPLQAGNRHAQEKENQLTVSSTCHVRLHNKHDVTYAHQR